MKTLSNEESQTVHSFRAEMKLTPLEQHSAWDIIKNEKSVMSMGKYFYIGMTTPTPMPTQWWEVDCHLLGLLTERKCRLLSEGAKYFIEYFILGERYKQYRRSLKTAEVA